MFHCDDQLMIRLDECQEHGQIFDRSWKVLSMPFVGQMRGGKGRIRTPTQCISLLKTRDRRNIHFSAMDWVNFERKSWIFKTDVHEIVTIGSFAGWICVGMRCSIKSILFKTINLLRDCNADELVWNKSARCLSICSGRFSSSVKVLTSITRISRSQVVALETKRISLRSNWAGELTGPTLWSRLRFQWDPSLSSSQLCHKWQRGIHRDQWLTRLHLVLCQRWERRWLSAFVLNKAEQVNRGKRRAPSVLSRLSREL